MCLIPYLSRKRGRSGFLYAKGKSLVFPLKRSSLLNLPPPPPLPGSKLPRLSDLVILRVRPARLLTLWKRQEKSDKREARRLRETPAFILGWRGGGCWELCGFVAGLCLFWGGGQWAYVLKVMALSSGLV